MKNILKIIASLTTVASIATVGAEATQAQTAYPESQMKGLPGWNTEAIFTVGESINGYTPTGILDGIGAFKLNNSTVRFLVNSELSGGQGYSYDLNTLDGVAGNEVSVPGGARIHFFDVDINSKQVVDGGLAFNRIFDRAGNLITDTSQFPLGASLNRFCSGMHVDAGSFGFVDDIYFAGEETDGGTEFVLDVASINSAEGGALYAAPALGRAAWENITPIDPGNENQVALLVGDDREAAPMYLYVGEKDSSAGAGFLERNGLAQGTLYVWVADSGETIPEVGGFIGTGNSRSGNWVPVVNIDPETPDADDSDGFDSDGYATQDGLDTQSGRAVFLGDTVVPGLTNVGAFLFSRPEDVATNPDNPNEVVMASTGRDSIFPDDSWGTTYRFVNDLTTLTAEATILYDGDDAGNGQFAGPDFGLRSPDNLDWADDGKIYIQEDRSVDGFCLTSGEEASIWRLDPTNGQLARVAQMDRSVVVPAGVTDSSPNDCGNWESSGILDVTELFGSKERLFVLDVQAHSLRDGIIASEDLVQGGQLVLMSESVPEPSATLGLFALAGAVGVGTYGCKRKK
ncbi:alkaline phosphatase PhoX [Crocosphaera chwakensis]|uniref:CHU large protein possible phytase n=1 Tax=Crocosphaera chwakensis CCY0110 TaxID=391612 RepID=A3IQU4_9CHRO|nr:alkaline phosphatase PhoX [Crocosphaera chwakensis]EAZ91149.1 CHU large protein; possible phytase [Crocosphaera chwakensis CCY0110]